MKNNLVFFKLKSNKTLFQTLLFLVVVFFISSLSLFLSFILKNLNPLEYGLIQGEKGDLEITYKEILFFASIVLCFFLLSLSYRYIKKRHLKLILISTASVYLFAAAFIVLVDSVYYLIFAYRITFSAVQTILNTNQEEVRGFIKLYYSPGRIIALLVFVIFIFLVIYNWTRFIALFSTGSFFIISLVLTVFGIIDFGQMAHSNGNGPHNVRYWDIIIGEYNEYNEFNRRLKVEKSKYGFSSEYDDFYKKDTLTKTLVFVISESLSKRHMSLYGYPRSTTPNLDSNKSIFKFNDCVSEAAFTSEAVPGLFFKGHLAKRINLITLLNKLGYETSWISNQSGWGKGDRSIVLLSQLCKQTTFMEQMADNDKANSSLHYDESVLEQFEKTLSKSSKASKFIVLHFMGCHFEYEKRYPSNRNFFKSPAPAKVALNTEQIQKNINSYDNAMRYHDSIVNEVVRIFSKHSQNQNSALVFLSDHGEELYENRDHAGHGYPPCKATAEIPYFAALSPDFKKNYPEVKEVMQRRKNTPYSATNNFYTLIDLLKIDSKKYHTRIFKNSFLSPAYDSTGTRLVMGIDYSTMNL